jgi:hypothetical protein
LAFEIQVLALDRHKNVNEELISSDGDIIPEKKKIPKTRPADEKVADTNP